MPAFDPANIEVGDYLECLEIRNISKATDLEYRFSCPFPGHENGDENASAYMNAETTTFFCHGCKMRGNAIHFAAQLLDISPLEAIRLLKERYQPGYLNPDAVSMVEEVRKLREARGVRPPSQPILPEETLYRFGVEWERAKAAHRRQEGFAPCDYMFERGFAWQALAFWGLGYDEISGRITIPVRDEAGNLIGFKGRAWWDSAPPKYLILGDKPNRPARYGWPCYFPSRVVFGAHRIRPDSDLVVCEGELNVIAMWQKTTRFAVAINGSHFTEHHARIIRRVARSVTLFLDSDEAGTEATANMTRLLDPFMPVKIVPPHEGDPADMTSDQIELLLGEARSALALALR